MKSMPLLPVLALALFLASCAPTVSGSGSVYSLPTYTPPASTEPPSTQPAALPSTTYSCAGKASGTFTNAYSTLDVTVNTGTGTASGTFSINGKQYAVSGTTTPLPGGQYLDLSGMVDGGRVTGNLVNGFTGNYKATVNNYRLSMTCS